MFRLREEDDFALDLDEYLAFIRERDARVAVLCNPNNPDGGYLPKEQVVRFLDQTRDLDLVIVDESFIDFVDTEADGSVADEAATRSNVIVLKSLGKNFGLHGIRFGYLVANPALAATVARALPKWNLNALAETVVHMVEDFWPDYERSLRLLARDRDHMLDELGQIGGLTVYPSTANFVMVKVPAGWCGRDLRNHLMTDHHVFVRECGNKLGMTSDFLRLVVRPPPTWTASSVVSRTTPSATARTPPQVPESPGTTWTEGGKRRRQVRGRTGRRSARGALPAGSPVSAALRGRTAGHRRMDFRAIRLKTGGERPSTRCNPSKSGNPSWPVYAHVPSSLACYFRSSRRSRSRSSRSRRSPSRSLLTRSATPSTARCHR